MNKHIVTVCVILNHSLDATHLSFNAFKAVKKSLFVLFVPYGMLFTTRTDFLIIVLFSLIALPLIFAVALIYPHGVF